MCDCVEQTNQKGGFLATKHHTRLCFTVPREPGFNLRVILKTELTPDAPRQAKPIMLTATFCPFCGVQYDHAPKAEVKR